MIISLDDYENILNLFQDQYIQKSNHHIIQINFNSNIDFKNLQLNNYGSNGRIWLPHLGAPFLIHIVETFLPLEQYDKKVLCS